MEEYKSFAISLAEKAGEIIKQNFSLEINREWKEDNSPITVTDTAINALALDAIGKAFPNHSILSEEGSYIQNKSEYTWVCDPLDGTAPFSNGIPFSSFCLALTKEGKSILGVIYEPYMKRLFFAEKGNGAFLNGKKIHVSGAASLQRGYVTLDAMNTNTCNLQKIYTTTHTHQVHFFSFKSSALSGAFVAMGQFTGAIYGANKAWDAAAVKIIVEEAGGKVTDLSGNDQPYDKEIKGFIASNGIVHDSLLSIIASSRI